MPWKLFFVLFCILLLSLVFWFNRDNVVTLSLVFTEFTGISVLLLIVTVFVAGGIVGSFFSTAYYRRKWRAEYGTTANTNKKKNKKKEKPNSIQDSSPDPVKSENES